MKQISVFIENNNGALLSLLQILGKSGIQLQSISIADTQEYGVCRLICDDSEKAFSVLKENGLAVSIGNVTVVKMPDKPGAAACIVEMFAIRGIGLAYVYSFVLDGSPMLAFRPDNPELAEEIIKENKLEIIKYEAE